MKVEARAYFRGDDAVLLSRGLRASDVREAWRVANLEPDTALRRSVAASSEVASVFVDGEIVAILGVGKNGRIGMPWLVGHEDFERRQTAVSMLRLCRSFAGRWHRMLGRLGNVADPENEKSMRFLEKLDFTIEWKLALAGPTGHKLVYFWR